MPKISVVVPVYKVEKYIHRCVDSILNQTFPDFELILVDDGSPDSCGAICDEYAKKDSRVVVIHQENGGLSAARNAGIDWAFANSDSQWLTFIDSDDWVHPQYLERVYCVAVEKKCDLAMCDYERVYENTEKSLVTKQVFMKNEILSNRQAVDKLASNEWWLYVHAWGKLYLKSNFKAIRFPEGYTHEDNAIVHSLMFSCKQVACVSDTLYYYWQHTASIMGDYNNPQHIDDLVALADRIKFADQYGFMELKEYTSIDFDKVFWRYFPLIITADKHYVKRARDSTRVALTALWKSSAISTGRKLRLSTFAFNPLLYFCLHNILDRKE